MIMTLPRTMVAIAALLGLGMSSGIVHAAEARDKLACYAWDIFPNERFKLNVKYHSRLTSKKEEREFGHARQAAYSVHGKHVIGGRMATVDGTVVTAKRTKTTNPEGPTGAHMGLHSIFVRGDGVFFGNDFVRPVTVECTSEESRSTPDVWTCQSRNEFDVYHGISKLTKVDAAKDELCSVFENGTFGDSEGAQEDMGSEGSMMPGEGG